MAGLLRDGVRSFYGPRLITSIVVGLVLVVVYVVYGYGNFKDELTNIDAERFWENIHPQVGISLLSMKTEKEVPKNIGNSGGLDEGYDPRVIPALWLNLISSIFEDSEYSSNYNNVHNISLPFLWGSFLEITSGISCTNFNCSLLLLDLGNNASKVGLPCQQKEVTVGFPECEITGPIDSPFTAEIRRFIGENYMFHNKEIPVKVIVLGIGLKSETSPGNLTFTFNLTKGGVEAMYNDYFQKYPETTEISILNQLKKAKEIWPLKSSYNTFEDNFPSPTLLTEDEFDPDLDKFADSEHKDNISWENMPHVLNFTKYFHEAELTGTHVGFHYDWRFFKKSDYSDYERKVILHRLAKAWLRFANSTGLKTWLAHGTLLGWYWNGMSLPWDQDMDVQMPYKSMVYLSQHFNQSLVVDLTDDPDIAGVHLYFIDVNPHYKQWGHGDQENVVDARFIDTDTGMYVDITALAISEEFHDARNREKASHRLHKAFNADYQNLVRSAELGMGYMDMKDLHQQLFSEEIEAWKHRYLYNCKDWHFYKLKELGPLLETSFEGEIAYVPRDFEAILRREYPKGLTSRCYENWAYRPYFGVWTPLSKCPKDLYGDQCDDRDMVLEEQYTRSYRLKRGHWEVCIKPNPRVDPFMIRRNNALWAATNA